MTVQVSTKFKELILDGNSFKSIFDQGRVLVYTGAQPVSADHPVQGTLLGQITLDGQPWVANGSDGGLVWERYGAWMGKPEAATWRLEVTTGGTAGWFRIVGPAVDNGGLSYSSPRIDGAVGNSGSDFYIVTPTLVANQSHVVQQFNFTFPPVVGG